MSETTDLVNKYREETGNSGLLTLFKLIDLMIQGCHKANEDNAGDEVLKTQGEIRVLKKLQKNLRKT